MEVAEPGWVHFSNQNSQHLSLRSAGGSSSSATVFPSHIIPASAYSHQPGNSIFLSHHSSSSLQLQPAERSVCRKYNLQK